MCVCFFDNFKSTRVCDRRERTRKREKRGEGVDEKGESERVTPLDMLCKLLQRRLQGYPRSTHPRRASQTQRQQKPARCILKNARNAKVQKWCADAGRWREDLLARCAEGARRNGGNLPRRTHSSGQGGLPSVLVSLHSARDRRHASCCMLNTLAFHDTHYYTAHST